MHQKKEFTAAELDRVLEVLGESVQDPEALNTLGKVMMIRGEMSRSGMQEIPVSRFPRETQIRIAAALRSTGRIIVV